MIAAISASALALTTGLVLAMLYNRLVVLRNRYRNALSQVDVQLRRRDALIPGLEAGGQLSRAAEERASAENRIAYARQRCHDAATAYDTARETFPSSVVARLFGFAPAASERQTPREPASSQPDSPSAAHRGRKAWRRAPNGEAIVRALGGRPVDPERECVLRNVAEEVALATGMRTPSLWVLDSTDEINAFAAGCERNETALCVTSGALRHLTRDELQGVVAHEFGHIANGDMRLNSRLTAFSDGLWGAANRLVRAIVREREYLADATAVRFTRNPEGLADALRRSLLPEDRAGLMPPSALAPVAHMLFQNRQRPDSSTHPSAVERIQRISKRCAGSSASRRPSSITQSAATSPNAAP